MRFPSAVLVLAATAVLPLGACDRGANPPPPASAGPATPAVSASAETTPKPGWFTDVTAESGLMFRHDAGVDGSFFYPQMLASGAALLDFDNDGDLDVYLVNGARRDGSARPTNRLFRQEADGTFVDVTDSSGAGDAGYGMGVAAGDYDNDGDTDLYVTNYGPDVLLRNNGEGTFTEVTAAAGIENPRWACSSSFVDYDEDGHLDLFVVNYVHYPQLRVCADQAGRPEYCGPSSFPGTVDTLYRNNGDGTFTDVSEEAGLAGTEGRGLGIVCEDFNGDGYVDVYVANDGEANFLWVNNGDGTFHESATMMGAALNVFANTEASMGVAAGDFDRDGDPDLFMTHLDRESNTLYRNDGRGHFSDETAEVGLAGPSFPLTGFGTAFLDFDHDGWIDLAIANGRVRRNRVVEGADESSPLAPYAEPNLLFRNDGAGRFVDTTASAGTFGRTVDVSRGLATGDLDGDGDLDLLVTNCHGPARVYRNDVADKGRWLIVRAVDPGLQRDVYGAIVTVRTGNVTQRRTVNPGYSYASSSDPRVHFGLGDAETIDELSVEWPDGQVERYNGVPVDQVLTVQRGRGIANGDPAHAAQSNAS